MLDVFFESCICGFAVEGRRNINFNSLNFRLPGIHVGVIANSVIACIAFFDVEMLRFSDLIYG